MCRTRIMFPRMWLINNVLFIFMIVNVKGLSISSFVRLKACTNINNYTSVLQDCGDFRKSKSFLHCLSQCTSNKTCNGVVRFSSEGCFFYKPCTYLDFIDTCSLIPVRVYTKPDPCGVGAIFNVSLGTCVCKIGWTGDGCGTAPTGCSDLVTQSYPVGTYWVEVVNANGTRSNLFCEITATGYRLHVFRNNGFVSHNKTFGEYSKGYKIDESNFWIGLDNMNKFAGVGNKQFKMEAVFANNVITISWRNMGVAIANLSNFYKITFSGSSNSASSSGYSVSITDCLSGSGIPFSAWDSDHDGSASNLAAEGGAGWYFRSSLSCNPLGRLPNSSATTGLIALPNLDLVNEAYVSDFKYVMGYLF